MWFLRAIEIPQNFPVEIPHREKVKKTAGGSDWGLPIPPSTPNLRSSIFTYFRYYILYTFLIEKHFSKT